jgi:hypothetical protein
MIDSLLLTAVRVQTYEKQRLLTNASGFFFTRDERLFLVTTRHVVIDEPSGHFPDRLEIELHIDSGNMTRSTGFAIPLYRNGTGLWRDRRDGGGIVDVAVIEIERDALPGTAVYRAFSPGHLQDPLEQVAVGTPLLIVGFPLGFHDTLHHMPVARHAVVASSFGLRFQGEGYFLTDARTHRGMSGAPVAARAAADPPRGHLPWRLLGIHSAVLLAGTRDAQVDEALALNSAWYADILSTLTEH